MGDLDTSVIIPAFNEQSQIGKLVHQIINRIRPHEIIVIDDGSIDDTAKRLKNSGARLIRHPYNIGNGAAIKSGIRAARGDVLVFMDADGQHDPADIEKLLAAMADHDMVVGARTMPQHASWRRWVGNRLLNALASYVTGFKVADLTSGFRAVRAPLARQILPLLPNAYSWPTTMTLALLRSGFSLRYVPIDVTPRRQGRSHIRFFHDGVRFLMITLKICTLYSPLRIFLPVSAAMFGLGLVRYFYTYWTTGRFTNMSALLMTASVLIFMLGMISEQISQMGFSRIGRTDDKGLPAAKDEMGDPDEG